MLNVGSIFSRLGNPDSLIPLAIKDSTSTAGMTVGSYITGKEEGHDRFIDEVGTEAIWLGGLPFFKWLYNKTTLRYLVEIQEKYQWARFISVSLSFSLI